jgi:hypothetical protein
VRKQLAEKRERLIELERKRFAGIRLEPLPHQFAYFDCSIEDGNPLDCLPAGRQCIFSRLGIISILNNPKVKFFLHFTRANQIPKMST